MLSSFAAGVFYETIESESFHFQKEDAPFPFDVGFVDLAGAIASQSQAVELAPGKRQEVLQKFLDELKSTADDSADKKKGSQ